MGYAYQFNPIRGHEIGLALVRHIYMYIVNKKLVPVVPDHYHVSMYQASLVLANTDSSAWSEIENLGCNMEMS